MNGDRPMTTPFLLWRMRSLPLCLLWALLLCLFISCTDDYVVNVLTQAEQMMESGAPDSALARLNNLRPEQIQESSLKARLSLDRAMALDKSYVDTSDLAILMPALDYYKGPFRRRERYLTAYYKGRILENGGQDNEALKAFTQAGILANRVRDSLYMVRICAAKARIYLRNLSFRQAEDAIDEGLRWCDPSSPYGQVLVLDKTEHLLERRRFDEAHSLLMSARSSSLRWLEDAVRLCRVYPAYLEEYEPYFNEYESSLSLMRPVVMAEYQLMKGQPFQALEFLDKDTPRSVQDTISHYLARRDAEIALGKFDRALESFRTYTSALEFWFTKVSEQDVRYVEERYRQQLQEQKRRQLNRLYTLLTLISLSSLVFWRIRYRARKKVLESKINALRLEYDSLLRWRNQIEEKNRQIGAILNTRIRALAPFLSEDLPIALDRSPELDRLLSDRKDILSNIGLLFALYHPAFIQELDNHGLDYIEIGFCCLYALGLRVNEIPDVVGRDAYHINPHIRKKVGLDSHDTNLPNWVRNLYSQLA